MWSDPWDWWKPARFLCNHFPLQVTIASLSYIISQIRVTFCAVGLCFLCSEEHGKVSWLFGGPITLTDCSTREFDKPAVRSTPHRPDDLKIQVSINPALSSLLSGLSRSHQPHFLNFHANSIGQQSRNQTTPLPPPLGQVPLFLSRNWLQPGFQFSITRRPPKTYLKLSHSKILVTPVIKVFIPRLLTRL